MKPTLKNPYAAILLVPLAVFLMLVQIGISPDPISLVSRIYVFALLAYVGARYVGKAPRIMWEGNMRPEARNVSGWAMVIVGLMCQMVYGFLYIVWERPEWLSSQYWGAAFIVMIATGLTLVASSVPRFPPFGSGPQGLSVAASFIVGFSSAMFLVVAQHIGQIWAVIKMILASASHAF